jgi:hypothetical protein
MVRATNIPVVNVASRREQEATRLAENRERCRVERGRIQELNRISQAEQEARHADVTAPTTGIAYMNHRRHERADAMRVPPQPIPQSKRLTPSDAYLKPIFKHDANVRARIWGKSTIKTSPLCNNIKPRQVHKKVLKHELNAKQASMAGGGSGPAMPQLPLSPPITPALAKVVPAKPSSAPSSLHM